MTEGTHLAVRWHSIFAFFAVVALMLFACSGDDGHEPTPPSSSSIDGTSSSSSVDDTPSSSSVDDTPSSSSVDDTPSSSSVDVAPSSSSVDVAPSSSSVDVAPSSSSADITLSSSSVSDGGSSSSVEEIHGNCTGFTDGTARLHEGKSKKQFCDQRDGTKYVYVDIGSQTWMAENLRYSGEDGNMGRCYKGESQYCETYGKLYTLDEMFCSSGCNELQWGVANPNDHSINIACPVGWHLPNTTEIEELWTNSDPNFVPGSEGGGTGRNTAATKLKVTRWGSGAGTSTDEFGFSGLPGGYCGSGCSNIVNNSRFEGSNSYWWSHAYGAPVPLAKSWQMTTNSAAVDDAYQSYSTSGFYTRCLKDKTPSLKTPEPAPQTLACSGNGTTGQKCHYGKWKDYFTDTRDGKEYPYVEIGEKVWMAANLDYSKNETIGKCYNGLDANCNIYGRLYNYEAAVSTSDKICPDGWHVPTDAEWAALTTAVNNGLIGTAAKLKAGSGWSNIKSTNGTYGIDGTDEDGFAALPGGYGNLRSGNYGTIVNFGSARGGFWWSAGSVAANGAQIRHIGPTLDNVTRVDNDKSRMYSVRCVLDE